jgi:hypothetical protein
MRWTPQETTPARGGAEVAVSFRASTTTRWRCIPIPPTDEDGWFVVDNSSDRKTTWGRWRPGDGGEPST